MVAYAQLLKSILVLVGLVLSALWLRRRGVVSSEHAPIFARLVTDFALPALIFVNLSTRSLS